MKFSFISASKLKKPARITLGILFIIASTFHFTAADTELQIIPPFLPWRRVALSVTGIFEFLGGIGVLIPRLQGIAGKGLAALLLAIFPANIYHIFARKQFRGLTRSPLYHILRMPLQGVLIWWALWATRRSS